MYDIFRQTISDLAGQVLIDRTPAFRSGEMNALVQPVDMIESQTAYLNAADTVSGKQPDDGRVTTPGRGVAIDAGHREVERKLEVNPPAMTENTYERS